MTKAEWLAQARRDQTKLESLIRSFHPVSLKGTEHLDHRTRITAPGAEAACQHVRTAIRKEFEGDPVAEFRAALGAGDDRRVDLILNQAWFGVPESTDCWRLEGFREAVDLMEDPPEEPGQEQGEEAE